MSRKLLIIALMMENENKNFREELCRWSRKVKIETSFQGFPSISGQTKAALTKNDQNQNVLNR